MNVPQVSVVVPTQNRSAMLRRTLGTVLGQKGVALEVIVVDEACEDDTARMLASLGEPRLSVVHHETAQGLAAARNSGLAEARAKWVAFCDDDDMWAPDKLVSQLEALELMPEAEWCASGAVHVDTELHVLFGFEPPEPGDVSHLTLAYNCIPGGGSGTIALTQAVRDVGGFDTRLKWGEDWDMWCRLSVRSPLAAVPRPLLAYLVHGENMSRHSPRFNRDVAVIESKYRAERSDRGVTLDRGMLEFVRASIDLDAGRRWSAAWHFLGQAYQDRGFRPVANAGVALLALRHLARRQAARRRYVPAGWSAEVEAWLEPLRLELPLQKYSQRQGLM
jgi:glycosyltransferase involved in cell wall biosynthesis